MEVLNIIATILMVISSLVLIGVILLQPAKTTGGLTIAGAAETVFGKHKAKSSEGKLALATKIAAAVFLIMCVAMVIIQQNMPKPS